MARYFALNVIIAVSKTEKPPQAQKACRTATLQVYARIWRLFRLGAQILIRPSIFADNSSTGQTYCILIKMMEPVMICKSIICLASAWDLGTCQILAVTAINNFYENRGHGLNASSVF